MYIASELRKITCFAPSVPTTTITTTAPMLDLLILDVQRVADIEDVQKVADIEPSQSSTGPPMPTYCSLGPKEGLFRPQTVRAPSQSSSDTSTPTDCPSWAERRPTYMVDRKRALLGQHRNFLDRKRAFSGRQSALSDQFRLRKDRQGALLRPTE